MAERIRGAKSSRSREAARVAESRYNTKPGITTGCSRNNNNNNNNNNNEKRAEAEVHTVVLVCSGEEMR